MLEQNAEEVAESTKRGIALAEVKAQRERQKRAALAVVVDILEVDIVEKATDEAIEKEHIRNLALNAQLRAEEVTSCCSSSKTTPTIFSDPPRALPPCQ